MAIVSRLPNTWGMTNNHGKHHPFPPEEHVKKVVIGSVLCLAVAGFAYAQADEDKDEAAAAAPVAGKLQLIKWEEVGKLSAQEGKAPAGAEQKPVVAAWAVGDKWTVDIFARESTKKTAEIKWSVNYRTFEYEVLKTERRGADEIVHIQVKEEGEDGKTVTLLVNSLTRGVVAWVRDGKETVADRADVKGMWDMPRTDAKGTPFNSILGVPRDAVIFSEGVAGFPASEVPKASGKVLDVEFKNAAGDDTYQRWDETISQFPLCSYTLERAALLRSVSKK